MAAAWLLQALYTSLLSGSGDDNFMLANTTYGTVKGKVDSQPEIPVAKFFGIPYAKPPTGTLRFKAPVPPDSWTGIRDAIEFSNQCMQRYTPVWVRNGEDQAKSEDCLYLNVYTPSRSSATSLPVMVWIHGGGYLDGAGSRYDATSLATQGVVMVTINYRLDVFGFLSTEDDVLPGNYGMMDQVAALQWVQDNIAFFGGNPNEVTVFGESAGASSVSLLLLSPLAKGLFKRAIMESGSTFCPWAMYEPGQRMSPRVSARLISVFAGCNELDNTTQLFECLQNVEANTLLNSSTEVYNTIGGSVLMYPRVETTYGFLPDYPSQLLAKGIFNQVDTIRGFNADEMGMAMDVYETSMGDAFYNMTKETASGIFREQLPFFPSLNQDIITGQFSQIFLSGAKSGIDFVYGLRDGMDALMFVGPILQEINAVSRSGRVGQHFLYQFSHKPSWRVNKTSSYISAVHTDEIFFIFNVSQKMLQDSLLGPADASDRKVSRQMMDLWVNFAKSGSPTSSSPGSATWKPYSISEPNYLNINLSSLSRQFVDRRYTEFFRTVLENSDGSKFDDVSDGIVGK